MSQEPAPPATKASPGLFSGRDLVLGGFIICLILGLIPARWAVTAQATPIALVTEEPTAAPSLVVTEEATLPPAESPTTEPVETDEPTQAPSPVPTSEAAVEPTATVQPSPIVTDEPAPVIVEVCVTNADEATVEITVEEETTPARSIEAEGCYGAELEANQRGKSGELAVQAVGFIPYTDTITVEIKRLTVTLTQVVTPTPSPAVATVAFVQSGEPDSIGLVNSNGIPIGNENILTGATAPTWSPDGSQLAVFVKPGNPLGSEGVWITGMYGENPRQVIGLDDIKNIAWSPQPQVNKIALELRDAPQPAQVWVLDPDKPYNSAQDTSIIRFNGEQPAWSPDGQKLVIKASGLQVVNFGGGDPQQITYNGTDSHPSWSPDGQYLAFASLERDEDWEIYLLRMSGYTPQGEPVRLTNQPGNDVTPVFGPDSRTIFFRHSADGVHWSLYAINVDGTNYRLVREGIGASSEWGLVRPAVK